jgi:hypothetical protein
MKPIAQSLLIYDISCPFVGFVGYCLKYLF